MPLAALAAVVHAAAAPTHAVEPFVSTAPAGASARVEGATTATPAAQTPAPAPVTTPIATPLATPAPTAPPPPTARPVPPPPPPTAPPAPQVLRNALRGPNGLDTGVGVYSDCSGATALTHTEAAIDTCVSGVTYFVGHNPGVFTPLMTTNVGAVITWWDGNGTAHALRIVAARTWQRADGVPPLAAAGVVAQFQTCQVSDGSVDRILDAVPA